MPKKNDVPVSPVRKEGKPMAATEKDFSKVIISDKEGNKYTLEFNSAYQVAAPLCAKGKFTNVYTPSPTAFPAGALYELINTTVRKRQSSTPIENFAQIIYQLDCYAKSKAECKALFNAVDERMISLGFTRMNGGLVDNFSNPSVFRITARYSAEIDRDGVIYRST